MKSKPRRGTHFYLLGPFLGLLHCAHTPPPTPPTEAQTKVFYDQGRRALEQKRCNLAKERFQQAKGNLTSPWSIEAWVGEADTLFACNEWGPALQAYDVFIVSHPHHPRVADGYCLYKRILSEYNELAGKRFVHPDKDQGALKSLHDSVLSFKAKHPDSPYQDAILQVRSLVEEKMTKHELYVADFYSRTQEHQAILWRLLHILQTYPRTTFEPEILKRIGDLSLRTNQLALAKRAYCLLVDGYSQHALARPIRRWLQEQHEPCHEVSPLRNPS